MVTEQEHVNSLRAHAEGTEKKKQEKEERKREREKKKREKLQQQQQQPKKKQATQKKKSLRMQTNKENINPNIPKDDLDPYA